ncbi:competence protein ComG [Geobacillus sp. FSL W8-0032]|uniref:competence protein ComG n=1 Tax=unclassified Geobacillus TaxID=2642459 RepID=UPI0030D75EEB
MCKKCSKGFLLVESLLALSLLGLTAAGFLPLLLQIAAERRNLVLEEQADQLLTVAMYEQPLVGEAVVVDGRTTFRLQGREEGERTWRVCVRWNDYVGRERERCGYSKR